MVSVKTLIMGPGVAFSTHLDVHSVIAQSPHLIRITDAIKAYIKSKRERHRTNEEIVEKLEKLEAVYIYVPEVHRAFHLARTETHLPPSRILYDGCWSQPRANYRPYSPISNYSNDFGVNDTSSLHTTNASVASHAQLIPNNESSSQGAQGRQTMAKGSSWQRFLPAYRRNSKPSTSNPLTQPEQTLYGSSAASSAVTITQHPADIAASRENELIAVAN